MRNSKWLNTALVGSLLATSGCNNELIIQDDAAMGGAGWGGAIGGVAGRGAHAGSGGDSAGDAGSGAGAGGAEPYVDDRPPRPPWQPTVPVGSTGFGQSTDLLCQKYYAASTELRLWSSPLGVYALYEAIDGCLTLDENNPCGHEGWSLQFNDGHGWRAVFDVKVSPEPGDVPRFRKLTGYSASPVDDVLVATTYDSIQFLPAAPSDPPLTSATSQQYAVRSLAAVNQDVFFPADRRDLGYALDGNQVLKWTPLSGWITLAQLPDIAQAIYGDANTIVVVGEEAVYRASASTGQFESLTGLPQSTSDIWSFGGVSVWAFSLNDIWIGTFAGELAHFDGSAWQLHPTGTVGSGDPMVRTLWGKDGQLYYSTSAEFGRWNGERVEPLLSNISVSAVTARALDEVFVGIYDERYHGYACGGHFTLFYDGAEFHPF